MKKWPKHIAIVGGGTAGWLAALLFEKAIGDAGVDTKLTVIESSKIGTVGVGEGTTALFRQILKHLNIDEIDFLRETGATIKYGIRHKDWRKLDHVYDGPIDDPNLVSGLPTNQAWLDIFAVATGKSASEVHLFQHLLNANKAPFASIDDKFVPAGPFHHAFHFDQSLAGDFLKKQAKNVNLVDDLVVDIKQDGNSGEISGLKLETSGDFAADFFIDCSGFSRCLINPLGAKWISYNDVLPVNRAMPFWIDIADEDEIDPCTLAWAQKSGWMWIIPTQSRYGCGYVYSDNHLTPDEAQQEIEKKLGHKIEPRADIKINSGRLENVWNKNCVAVGLSSSFLEPLEATSIHGTLVQLMLLTALIDNNTPNTRDKYNITIAQQVDDFRDFIRTHYVSERRDSDFWKDVAKSTPENISDRVEYWQNNMPSEKDFPPFLNGLPHVEQQLYFPVLNGLGLLDRNVGKNILNRFSGMRAQTRKTRESLLSEYKNVTKQVLGHRQFLKML